MGRAQVAWVDVGLGKKGIPEPAHTMFKRNSVSSQLHKEGIWDAAVKLDALRGQVKASTQEWYEDKLLWDKMPPK